MIVLFVLNEVIEEDNVTEIYKTVALVGLLWLPVVCWHVEVVKSTLVVYLKVLPEFLDRIPAWNVANHEIGPGLLATQYLFVVDGTTVKLIVREERRIRVLFLEGDLAVHAA